MKFKFKFNKLVEPGWWLPKGICLIAACMFWVYVMNEQNPLVDNSYTVPVEVRNLDRSLVALNIPKQVDVRVRMNRNDLLRLRSEDLKAYVDLRNVSAGTFPNTPIHVTVPSDGEVLSENPPSVDLVVDTYAVKSVPVTVQFFGESEKGFSPVIERATPDAVTIAGSNTSVSAVDRVVVSVDVSGRKKSFSEFDSANVLDNSGNTVKGLEVVPTQVKVDVHMKEEQRTATLPLRVSITGMPAEGYHVKRVVITPSSAAIAASMGVLEPMKEISLGNFDISGMDSNVTREMNIPVPEGGVAVPRTASVTVEIEKSLIPPQVVEGSIAPAP